MRINLAILLTTTMLAFAGTNALANRPVAQLPDGDMVDLNTGIATTPAGAHYQVSPAELQTLRQQAGANGAQPEQGATASATAAKPEQGQPPR